MIDTRQTAYVNSLSRPEDRGVVSVLDALVRATFAAASGHCRFEPGDECVVLFSLIFVPDRAFIDNMLDKHATRRERTR